jgi:hypothetical protein
LIESKVETTLTPDLERGCALVEDEGTLKAAAASAATTGIGSTGARTSKP